MLLADCGKSRDGDERNFRRFVTFPWQDDALRHGISRENHDDTARYSGVVQQSLCKKHQREAGARHKAFTDSVCPWHQKWIVLPRNGIRYSMPREISLFPLEIEITPSALPAAVALRLLTKLLLAETETARCVRALNNSLLNVASTRRKIS